MAPLHSTHSAPTPAPPQVIDEFIPPPQRLIDIGCGTSRIAERLAQQGHAVHAVDNSSEAIGVCEERLRADPLPARASSLAAETTSGSCRFALADLTAETSFAAGCFDAAVDKGTLDCLDCLGKAGMAIREVHRLVKDGGLLVSVSCRCDAADADLRRSTQADTAAASPREVSRLSLAASFDGAGRTGRAIWRSSLIGFTSGTCGWRQGRHALIIVFTCLGKRRRNEHTARARWGARRAPPAASSSPCRYYEL